MTDETIPSPAGGAPIAPAARRSSTLVTEMLELTRPECLRLLAATGFGRIVISVPGWDHPVIRPVNYVFDEASQSVLIRSAPGSKLHAVLRSPRAVFEIDGAHPDGRLGWSVIISGVAEEITHEAELRRVDELDLEPLAPGYQGHWIRIRTNTVSGRRIAFVSDNTIAGRA
jgi:nitroimidazol reductase NimA-like FMN-containing flavoprotein (pyridoxamine 5'-phosphate oxidase superfamily)